MAIPERWEHVKPLFPYTYAFQPSSFSLGYYLCGKSRREFGYHLLILLGNLLPGMKLHEFCSTSAVYKVEQKRLAFIRTVLISDEMRTFLLIFSCFSGKVFIFFYLFPDKVPRNICEFCSNVHCFYSSFYIWIHLLQNWHFQLHSWELVIHGFYSVTYMGSRSQCLSQLANC